jgi:hypothetical protein
LTAFLAVGGGEVPYSSSIRRSLETNSLACKSSTARTVPLFQPAEEERTAVLEHRQGPENPRLHGRVLPLPERQQKRRRPCRRWGARRDEFDLGRRLPQSVRRRVRIQRAGAVECKYAGASALRPKRREAADWEY